MDNGSVLTGYCTTGTLFFLRLCGSLIQRATFGVNTVLSAAGADRLC